MASAFYERAFLALEAMASPNIAYLFSQISSPPATWLVNKPLKTLTNGTDSCVKTRWRCGEIFGSSLSVSLLMMCETFSGKT